MRNLSYFCLVCKLCSSPPKVTPQMLNLRSNETRKKKRKEKIVPRPLFCSSTNQPSSVGMNRMLNRETDLSRATVKQSVVFRADVHLQEESADTDGPVGKTSRTDMSTFLSDSAVQSAKSRARETATVTPKSASKIF